MLLVSEIFFGGVPKPLGCGIKAGCRSIGGLRRELNLRDRLE